jgi:hypothetical protein
MIGGKSTRKWQRSEGPVAVPRSERVQLRRTSSSPMSGPMITSSSETVISDSLLALGQSVESTVSSKISATNSAWYGQSLDYAAGVYLRREVLEPLMHELIFEPIFNESARLLGHFSRGQIVLLRHSSGVAHRCSIERVTNKDGQTLTSWWQKDKVLSHTGNEVWSEWWVRRCFLFDPGCEMIKLIGENGEILAVAYFERNVIDKHWGGNRITLIRGIRVDPELNPDAIHRSKINSVDSLPNVSFPDAASALLYHIVFISIRHGVQGVAVNSPKADAIEAFYQKHMGSPLHIDDIDGRRYFRLENRADILRKALRDQIDLMLSYNYHQGAFVDDNDRETEKNVVTELRKFNKNSRFAENHVAGTEDSKTSEDARVEINSDLERREADLEKNLSDEIGSKSNDENDEENLQSENLESVYNDATSVEGCSPKRKDDVDSTIHEDTSYIREGSKRTKRSNSNDSQSNGIAAKRSKVNPKSLVQLDEKRSGQPIADELSDHQ